MTEPRVYILHLWNRCAYRGEISVPFRVRDGELVLLREEIIELVDRTKPVGWNANIRSM